MASAAPATDDEPGVDEADAEATSNSDQASDSDAAPRSRVIRWSGPSLEKASAPAAGKQPPNMTDEDEDEDEDEVAEDHYVPPPVPPMPPAHPVTKWGIVALLLGMVLLVAPTLLGLEHTTPVNLVGVLEHPRRRRVADLAVVRPVVRRLRGSGRRRGGLST